MPPPFTLLQSEWWARVKKREGWRILSRPEPLVLSRAVGPWRLAYAPHAFAGRNVGLDSKETEGAARSVREQLTEAVRQDRVHVVRWDVPWDGDGRRREALLRAGFTPSATRVQPPDTVVVPLADDDAMLAAMHKKTRYNIRLAAKRGVTVERVTGEEMLEALPRWYRLYRETAARDRISIHSEQYYHTVLSTSVEMIQNGERAPRCALYFARHEDDLLAGIVVASWDGMSTYLYGAGADHKRNLMPSYLIQWETMRTARDAGDRAYDLFGIPPGADPDHPMHGLYRFKTGFGGEIVHRPGCWDIDVARGWGRAFRTAERARAWYHHDFRKRVGA